MRETFCLDYNVEYFFLSLLSLFYENGFSKHWELFHGSYFSFLVFLFFLEIETKETKDNGKYFKTLQDLITLNWKEHWELFHGSDFSFLVFLLFLKIETKETKDKNARKRAGLNSSCLFCLLFIKKDSPNAGGNPRRAFSRFYFFLLF